MTTCDSTAPTRTQSCSTTHTRHLFNYFVGYMSDVSGGCASRRRHGHTSGWACKLPNVSHIYCRSRQYPCSPFNRGSRPLVLLLPCSMQHSRQTDDVRLSCPANSGCIPCCIPRGNWQLHSTKSRHVSRPLPSCRMSERPLRCATSRLLHAPVLARGWKKKGVMLLLCDGLGRTAGLIGFKMKHYRLGSSTSRFSLRPQKS